MPRWSWDGFMGTDQLVTSCVTPGSRTQREVVLIGANLGAHGGIAWWHGAGP